MNGTCLYWKDRYNSDKDKRIKSKIDKVRDKKKEDADYYNYLRDTRERFRRLAN